MVNSRPGLAHPAPEVQETPGNNSELLHLGGFQKEISIFFPSIFQDESALDGLKNLIMFFCSLPLIAY